MVRSYWRQKLEETWLEKSVIWLSGVRRTGKTTLCKQLAGAHYYDCELPRVRDLLIDPEVFFQSMKTGPVVLDEIHRLENASEVLKIGADYFSTLKIVATGSATLSASRKFKDTLTDRKRSVFLPPIVLSDMKDFAQTDLKHRLSRGGLPPFFLAKEFPEKSYQEWLDSFWAKDIEELFNLEKKSAFLKMFELLALQSGGLFEAKSFSAPCGISHTTVASYLNVMEQTHVAYVLRAYHKRASNEIIAAPKVYLFDTGFITYFKGFTEVNPYDLGYYWEHFVLNEILSFLDRDVIHFWRDKQKNEVDFVIKLRGKSPIAIECKWQAKEFDSKALLKFRELHDGDQNYLVAADAQQVSEKKYGPLRVKVLPLAKLKEYLIKK